MQLLQGLRLSREEGWTEQEMQEALLSALAAVIARKKSKAKISVMPAFSNSFACLHEQEKAARCCTGAPRQQNYLRVSVGVPSGCSPGIPYVLEIWPAGHFSPVHNHGNAFGIVRMLHGSITGQALSLRCAVLKCPLDCRVKCNTPIHSASSDRP